MSAAPGLAMAQQAPWNAQGHARQPPRPRLCVRTILQHGVGDRPGRQPAARRHQTRRSPADELLPALQGQVLVHGLGFSPDGKTLAVVSIGSNAVSWIDTATNTVKHTTYVGRSPHEAFFTPDGKEVWVTVRGEDYIAVLDPTTYKETGRIKRPVVRHDDFSPDGRYGYVCSSFNPVWLCSMSRPTRRSDRWRSQAPSAPTSPRRRTASKCGLR